MEAEGAKTQSRPRGIPPHAGTGRREPRKSWVKISQIRTLSVERLSRKIGRAKPEEVELAITGLNQIVAP